MNVPRSQRVVRSEPIVPQAPTEFLSGSNGATFHDASFTHVHGPQIQEHKSTDVCEFQDLMPGSYLASATIEKVQNSPPRKTFRHFQAYSSVFITKICNLNFFRGMTFETSAAEGAVLTMPEGSRAMDLQTIGRFHAYAEANLESWYRYVNGPRGIDVKNGELRLVVGCDKVTSYGTAALSNISQQRINYLKFGIIGGDAVSSERLSGSTLLTLDNICSCNREFLL